ncbi:MAG: hypothetical protein RR413_10890, partial [Christensenellaceae bacterium]
SDFFTLFCQVGRAEQGKKNRSSSLSRGRKDTVLIVLPYISSAVQRNISIQSLASVFIFLR